MHCSGNAATAVLRAAWTFHNPCTFAFVLTYAEQIGILTTSIAQIIFFSCTLIPLRTGSTAGMAALGELYAVRRADGRCTRSASGMSSCGFTTAYAVRPRDSQFNDVEPNCCTS